MQESLISGHDKKKLKPEIPPYADYIPSEDDGDEDSSDEEKWKPTKFLVLPYLTKRVFGTEEITLPKPLEVEHTEPEPGKKKKKNKSKKNKGAKKPPVEEVEEEPIKRIEIVRSQPVQFSKPNSKKPQPQKGVEPKPAQN